MIFELMKAQRLGIYPDLHTKYVADAFKNTSSTITEMSGELPLAFVTTGLPLTNYKAYGNAVQAATPSPDNPAEVQAVGDKTTNLFDVNAKSTDNGYVFNKYLNTNGKEVGFSSPINAWNISEYIEIEPNTTYCFTDRLPHNAPAICEYDENYNYISGYSFGSTDKILFTSSSNAKFVRLPIYTSDSTIINYMFNKGETALPYEPYGYKIPFTTAAEDGTESITTTAYLDKPLYKIGDYADTLCYAEQKVDRVVRENILTGNEDWRLQSINSNGIANFYFYPNGTTPSFVSDNFVLSSHFEQQNTTIANTNSEGVFLANRYIVYIRVKQERASTITDFKSYLAAQYAAGTPVKIYYVLATPESESVELPKLPTLDGVTVIDAATEIKPSKMDIKYTALNLLTFSREV